MLRAFRIEETDRVPVTLSYVDPFTPLEEDLPGYRQFQRLIGEHCDILAPSRPESRGVFYSSTPLARIETTSTEDGPYTYHESTITTPEGSLHSRAKSERGIRTQWRYESYIKSDEDVEKILSVPDDPLEVDASPIKRAQEKLGDRGVVSTGDSDPICQCAVLYTLRDFALTANRRSRALRKLLKFFAPRIEDFTKQMSEQCTDVFFRVMGPEYVTPPILPPKLFDEYVVPFDKRLVRIIKENDNIAGVHCHGRIGTVIDGMKEIDPHALEPIEPPPGGDISLASVKEKIGDTTCLMGYLQHNDLEFCAPERIRDMVHTSIREGGEGGGYVAFPTARPYAAVSDRLLRNYMEVIKSARAFGQHARGS
jgi:hypothetical protein